jgi:hypothetical protein
MLIRRRRKSSNLPPAAKLPLPRPPLNFPPTRRCHAPDLRTIFQGGIFLLLLLAACYGAAEIVLPIAVAFVLMLVLQLAMRFPQRWHVPRGLAAAALIVMLFGTLAASARRCRVQRQPGSKRSRPGFPSCNSA